MKGTKIAKYGRHGRDCDLEMYMVEIYIIVRAVE
jgi:hypothetical protein